VTEDERIGYDEQSLEGLLQQTEDRPWQAKRGYGRIAIRIDRDGRWYYRDSLIERPNMVQLFASLLRVDDDGGIVIDAPEQILRIQVDDAPFVAVDCEPLSDGSGYVFVTNLGDRVIAGPEHPLELRMAPDEHEQRLYLHVRDGMLALVHRNLFYHLVELASEDSEGRLGIRSRGEFYPLG